MSVMTLPAFTVSLYSSFLPYLQLLYFDFAVSIAAGRAGIRCLASTRVWEVLELGPVRAQ